jgi:hypothetical protein
MKIFLDIDNVEVNWTGRAIETLGMNPHDEPLRSRLESCETLSDLVDCDELWRKIGVAGARWWADLPSFPWARKLWHVCNRVAPTSFLSTPWYGAGDDIMEAAAAGKVRWIRKNFTQTEFFLGVHKERCASPDALLIDDNTENCEKFKAAGGHAFRWPNPLKMRRERTWNRTILDLLGFMEFVAFPDLANDQRQRIRIMQERLRAPTVYATNPA